MRFYTHHHRYYYGIDLDRRVMYLCITDAAGTTPVHKNPRTDPEAPAVCERGPGRGHLWRRRVEHLLLRLGEYHEHRTKVSPEELIMGDGFLTLRAVAAIWPPSPVSSTVPA